MFDAIPAELRTIDRCVGWRLECRDDKWTKPPKTVEGRPASSTDPATWSTFDDARDAYLARRHRLDGVGIVLIADDDLVAVDIDHATDPDGKVKPWAQEIVDRFGDAYVERSPSGTGLRILCRGRKLNRRCKAGYHDGAVEVYERDRFVTLTGHRLSGGDRLPDCTDALAWLAATVFPEKPKAVTATRPVETLPDDAELLAKAFDAKNGPKLRRLFDGDWDGYPSRSEADLALASGLAFYTGPDPARLGRLLRQSGLAREKWDRPGDNYFARTVGKALADATGFYTPGRNGGFVGCRVNGHPENGHPEGGIVGSVGCRVEETPEWEAPAPLRSLPAVAPFDFDLLPVAFREFVRDAAERMQAPPDYIGPAMMVALGSVVAGQVGIRPKERDDWTEITNLWGGIVGRPGVLKSPALEQALKFLKRMEAEEREKFIEAARDWQKTEIIRKAKAKATEAAIVKAVSKGGNADALADQFVAEQEEGDAPIRRRYMTSDATVEKLGAILAETGRNVLTYRDELPGFFRSLDKQGNESARQFYLEAWSGLGSFTFDRIGRGTIDIPTCRVSVFGGVQPGPLAEYLSGATNGGRNDDGLMQRFSVFVWPDVPKVWRNVDRWPDTEAKNAAHEVFRRLADIDPAKIGATVEAGSMVPYLRFDPDAQRAFNEWRAGLEARLRSGTLPAVLEAHLAKYRKLVPALSLLMHLADGHAGPVGVESIRKAVGWAAYLETHARRVYGAAIDPTRELARSLLVKIRAGELSDGFSLRDVYRREWSGLADREQVEPVVRLLCETGWLREEREQKTKPKFTYYINPAAFEPSAEPTPDISDESPPDDGPDPLCEAHSPNRHPTNPTNLGDPTEPEAFDDEVTEWRA